MTLLKHNLGFLHKDSSTQKVLEFNNPLTILTFLCPYKWISIKAFKSSSEIRLLLCRALSFCVRVHNVHINNLVFNRYRSVSENEK